MSRRRRASAEGGFTLVELLATMAVAGILATIALWSFRSFRQATSEQGSAQTIVEALRGAQTRAQAENVPYEVQFAPGGTTWTVLRHGASGVSQVSTGSTSDPSVYVRSSSFTQPSGAVSPDAYFYPRGNASGGSLVVARKGSAKTYVVTVEGLTAHVSMA